MQPRAVRMGWISSSNLLVRRVGDSVVLELETGFGSVAEAELEKKGISIASIKTQYLGTDPALDARARGARHPAGCGWDLLAKRSLLGTDPARGAIALGARHPACCGWNLLAKRSLMGTDPARCARHPAC